MSDNTPSKIALPTGDPSQSPSTNVTPNQVPSQAVPSRNNEQPVPSQQPAPSTANISQPQVEEPSERLEPVEIDDKVGTDDTTPDFALFGGEAEKKAEDATASALGPAPSGVTLAPSPAVSAVELENPITIKEEPVSDKKLEKPPVMGQLQLKQLLSETSMRIVDYAQKLAESPLVGLKDTLPVAAPGIPSVSISPAATPSTKESAMQGASDLQSGIVAPSTDRFPSTELTEFAQRPTAQATVMMQEEDLADQEPYDFYTVPEGAANANDVPACVRTFLQTFNDDKQPLAKIFKLEDEDRLNEAATWDIQNTYELKPSFVIRCTVLERMLQGILQFRLSKIKDFQRKNSAQLMQILNEDVATTLAQLRFSSYKYCYFVTLVAKNHQDVCIATRQLWDPETDRRVIATYETLTFHSSVTVHFVYHP